ncbi:hypothetical protein ACFZDJ_27745 [Streptomyces sp. NPDC007896]|uniref:hypothetical protein n=1 Tax=Streptomyces sp. NPDC007896 TaxID=3364784 RepID=UPI0036E95706
MAVSLRDLPPTWHKDLFTSSPHSPAATCRTVLELPGPETAPYDPLDWEDCPAAPKPRTSAATTAASSTAWSTNAP